ncbi:hypothetical protein BGZ76_001676 [Entomortierella beljakovae]|nr:hypothetical protein BGZ76_001676 [Entomortierella beljakovae]
MKRPANDITAVSCLACGENGHSSPTHRLCPHNPRHLSIKTRSEINKQRYIKHKTAMDSQEKKLLIKKTRSEINKQAYIKRKAVDMQEKLPIKARIEINKQKYRQKTIINKQNQENLLQADGPIAAFSMNETIEYQSLGRNDTECRYCSSKLWIEERLADSSVKNPKFTLCCGTDGRVQLPSKCMPPIDLRRIFGDTCILSLLPNGGPSPLFMTLTLLRVSIPVAPKNECKDILLADVLSKEELDETDESHFQSIQSKSHATSKDR